jgi:hypothetical protein
MGVILVTQHPGLDTKNNIDDDLCKTKKCGFKSRDVGTTHKQPPGIYKNVRAANGSV